VLSVQLFSTIWSTVNFDRIIEVFSFRFDPDTAFLFTCVEFWIFFTAVLGGYVVLSTRTFVRTLLLSLLILLSCWFFQNGDLMVLGGVVMLNFTFTSLWLRSGSITGRNGLIVVCLFVINGLAIYYYWFKLSYFHLYFTVRPIDVWLLFLLSLFLLSYFKQKTLLRAIFLSAVSYYFYYKSSDKFVFLLFFSVLSNYGLGKWLFLVQHQLAKKWLVAFSIVLNIAILGYFKYTYFFTDAFNTVFGTQFVPTNKFAEWANWLLGEARFSTDILLPVGVSFFTFQTISYIVDIYRKEVEPVKNIFDYAFFVTFFPPLVSGPIVRARDFIPQIRLPFHLTKRDYSLAVVMIVTGLLKKVVLADYIAVHFIDKIVDAPQSYPGFVSVLAMWGYSLQIYGDFSGYTDIAIGLSLLMGFRLLKNFNSPYKAVSVADFWRRWHISLGSWLRDYLYIPLGGNRSGKWGTFLATFFIFIFLVFITQWYDLLWLYIALMLLYWLIIRFVPVMRKDIFRDMNLIITMVIGGLWHGASENFVIWGAMNGVALIVYNHWKKISPYEKTSNIAIRFWRIFLTFNFITFTRIWFRLEEDGMPKIMLDQILNHFDFSWDTFVLVLQTYQPVFWIMVVGFVIHWLPDTWKDGYKNLFAKLPTVLQIVSVACIIVLMYQAMLGESKAFVYFQF